MKPGNSVTNKNCPGNCEIHCSCLKPTLRLNASCFSIHYLVITSLNTAVSRNGCSNSVTDLRALQVSSVYHGFNPSVAVPVSVLLAPGTLCVTYGCHSSGGGAGIFSSAFLHNWGYVSTRWNDHLCLPLDRQLQLPPVLGFACASAGTNWLTNFVLKLLSSC